MGFFSSTHCQICDVPFKRGSYHWKLEGKSVCVCPECNRRLERNKSRVAFNPATSIIHSPVKRTESWRMLGDLIKGAFLLVVIFISGFVVYIFISGLVADVSFNHASAAAQSLPPKPLPTAPLTPAILPLPILKLRDVIHFPVTVVAPADAQILVKDGGFGVLAGDEITISGKSSDSYLVQRPRQHFIVPSTMLDDYPLKQ